MDMVDEEDLKNLLNDQAQVKHEEQLKIQEK